MVREGVSLSPQILHVMTHNIALDDALLFTEDSGPEGLSAERIDELVEIVAKKWVLEQGVKKLLLLPPDHTRLYSYAGPIAAKLWELLHNEVEIDLLPALGTHAPMTPGQLRMMFGESIPVDRFIPHDWRNDLQELGEIPGDFLAELSDGRFNSSVKVAVNHRLVSGEYDMVLSLGQVVPHEVIGFANHSKNICIGCGGGEMLHMSHFLGALCGIEDVLGEVDTPVRRLMDKGFYEYVRPHADIRFVLTVVEDKPTGPLVRAMTAGTDSECFRWAAKRSAELNLTKVERPIDRCVVFLDPREFSSTWLGNKAVYRTRKAMADMGELIVLAPAVHTFGEDIEIDQLIRKYGYCGTPNTLKALDADPQLANNLSAAAHLIHGSSEGRFHITYCTAEGMTSDEVRSVGYSHQPYVEAAAQYDVEQLKDGWNHDAEGDFYFIRNPALGLWTA